MVERLDGIYIPAVTPFDEAGEFQEEWLLNNIKIWNQTGVTGYMCLGSNGEFRMLDDDEAFRVVQIFAENAAPDKTVIAGIGRESLYQTLKFLKRLEDADLKLDYVSVLTPHYFKKLMTEDALYDYFTAIADASRYPVLLYCAPGFANTVCISGELLKRLADHPNIHGIKDTSADMIETYFEAVGGRDDFNIMAGSINNFEKCLKLGGASGMLSVANYFPEESCRLYEKWKNDTQENFYDYYDKLKVLVKNTGVIGGVAGVKAMMNLLGYTAGMPRKPVQPWTEEQIEAAKAEIAAKDLP